MRHRLFPDIDIPDALISRGFSTRDVYGNDSAVRLTRGDLSLWVDHADADQREVMGAPRFAVHRHDEYMQQVDPEACFESLDSLAEYLSIIGA